MAWATSMWHLADWAGDEVLWKTRQGAESRTAKQAEEGEWTATQGRCAVNL